MAIKQDLTEVLGKEAIADMLEQAGPELRKYDALDFSGFNFEAIRRSVVEGKIARYLPSSSGDVPPLPETNERGEIAFELGPATMAIPEAYAPYVRYVHEVFGTPTGEKQAELGRILGYFHTVRQWVGSLPVNLEDQIGAFLAVAPAHLHAIEKRLVSYEAVMAEDSNFEVIAQVPYMYEYLLRLMMDQAVPAEVKVDIAMGIVYFASPVDVIPEAFVDHPISFADDACVCLWVIRAMEGTTVEKETIEGNWPGRATLPLDIGVWEKPLVELVGEDLYENVNLYFASKRGPRSLGN